MFFDVPQATSTTALHDEEYPPLSPMHFHLTSCPGSGNVGVASTSPSLQNDPEKSGSSNLYKVVASPHMPLVEGVEVEYSDVYPIIFVLVLLQPRFEERWDAVQTRELEPPFFPLHVHPTLEPFGGKTTVDGFVVPSP